MKGVDRRLENLIELQRTVFPDYLKGMESRVQLLYTISLFEPIGRRGLVEKTELLERQVRNEVETLEGLGLITVTGQGTRMNQKGKEILYTLRKYVREYTGLVELERALKEKYHLQAVHVVSGDVDEQAFSKAELGRATVSYLKEKIKEEKVIAVTGGTTLTAVAEAMHPLDLACTFVPTRGGVGTQLEHQANTLAAEMAEKSGGQYALLHVPDPLSEALFELLAEEASLQETLQLIREANLVLHGVGSALELAKRRQTSPDIVKKLHEKKAVAEAFGYYFDADGQVVHQVHSLGLQLEDLEATEAVVTIAGGQSKAKAIKAFLKQGKTDVLVTDEFVARSIL